MIREIIEARALEVAVAIVVDPKCCWQDDPNGGVTYDTDRLAAKVQSAFIAILTDPEIGFKEALSIVSTADIAVVFQEEAEAKLAEIQELEAKNDTALAAAKEKVGG